MRSEANPHLFGRSPVIKKTAAVTTGNLLEIPATLVSLSALLVDYPSYGSQHIANLCDTPGLELRTEVGGSAGTVEHRLVTEQA